MKKIINKSAHLLIIALAYLLINQSIFAQAPEIMSYQAVIRDGSNALVASSSVGMQISILKGSSSGTAVYVETQTPTSNANGLVSIEIGGGTMVSGDFSTIDWANGPYFVKTETDPIGGTSYTITGTSQLLCVPYALFAKNSSAWQTIDDTTSTFNQVGIGSTSTYLGVELIVKDNVFASQVIESTGATTDAELWLKNPTGVWRIHGDQSDGNKFKLGLWTDYSEAGGSNILPNSMTVDTLGNVGIGTASPARKLHVNDVMRLEPRATAPANPSKGDIYMDDTTNKLMVYDGSTWRACW